MQIISKILRVLWISEYRSALLRTRVFASTEHDAILAGLTLDSVVDIGANRGQFALCARRLYPTARIYSFEPLSRPASVYRRVFSSDPRAQLFQSAVADSTGEASMHVTRWDVSSSLLPIAQAQHDNYILSEEAGRETVRTGRLGDYLDAQALRGTALLKLDVQGFELPALRGCEGLLDYFSYVYVEVSFIELYTGQALAGDVTAYLMEKGFRLAGVANLSSGRSRRPIQCDFLFSRSTAGGLRKTTI